MTYNVVKRQGLFVIGQINKIRITIKTGIKHIGMDQRVLIENQINKMKAINSYFIGDGNIASKIALVIWSILKRDKQPLFPLYGE